MSVDASQAVCERAGSGLEHLDLVRVREAFAIEELEYCGLLGVCHSVTPVRMLKKES